MTGVASGSAVADAADRRPMKGELFGAERLAAHARKLARRHTVASARPPRWRDRRDRGPLLSRLDATERALTAARDSLTEASAAGADVGPAGAWLLDNFFVVIEQIPEIRSTLPAQYYRELPKLSGGPRAGYPRIYDIVVELIAHTDGRLDEASVGLMIAEYQRISPLTLGELWAIPAMLRMGYLDSARRMALRAARDVADRASADEWVSRLLGVKSPGEISGGLSAFVHRGPDLTPAFLTRFLQQIRSRRSDFTPLLWLEQWVAEDVMTVEDAAQRSVQELALTQLVMANSIASLRLVTAIDWTAFVEEASVTEAVLRRDPAGTYRSMTRATRDRYRHAVERIAKGTGVDEPAIAEAAVHAGNAAAATDEHTRARHVGYHLVGEGRHAFERSCAFKPDLVTRMRETVRAHPAAFYFGAVVMLVALVLAAMVAPLRFAGPDGRSLEWLVVALVLALLPASDAAVAIVHQLVNLLIPATRLPRLDYEGGVPERDRTAVVVPLLLGSVEAVTAALDHIEVQYLANHDPQIRFALLSDFVDSPTQRAEGDDTIVAAAVAGIRALNVAHGGETRDGTASSAPFYLLHRPRRWNAADGVWMGWERKRGKLVEFNAFIRGEADGSFDVTEGDLAWLRGVRYAITLDADTVLPRSGAAALIGAIAHPLNRAEYDPTRGRVVRGYGILQPRVSVSLASASESRFAAVYSGHPGLDPYTTAVSDVYQDLFGEGTFTGKGIYDVDVFRSSTDGRFPENSLLSHDLLEGTFARAGLVTDIEVFDDYPTRYLTSTRRAHRWIRGDWQLLRWLTSRVPGSANSNPHPLSALSRWKIADNMRRSATPVAQLAWLTAALLVLPGSWVGWVGVTVAAFGAPWIVPLLFAAARPPRGQAWGPYYDALAHDASRALQQLGLAIVFLPNQAVLATDAILRTVVRVRWTRRKMLEWQTASHTEQTTGTGRLSAWRRMWPSVLLGAAIVALVAWHGEHSALAGPRWWMAVAAWGVLAIAWPFAPEAATALSRPLARRNLVLDSDERAAALRYAARHWRYFERFVTAETHWLAPDNFQETPHPVVASRTSPTNIGLQLLATASACDLGFLARGETADRLERAFDSLDRMTRIQGHFFNWYSLDDLRVLDPPYVSTVDSGNLAGHLVALAQGCIGIAAGAVDDGRVWAAIEAEGIAHGSGAGAGAWVGERLLAYQSAILDLRRSTQAGAAAASTATTLWARQRLEAAAGELAQFELDAEADTTVSLRMAALTSPAAASLVARFDALGRRAREMAMAIDFRLVYEPQRRLFAIGYDARRGTLDDSMYDLLASESRLASFIAIAKDDTDAEHWFRLGRSLTVADGATALVSWSGTMFEYLMPLLVMPPRPFSLLDQTCLSAVQRQIAYAGARGVPWGISESAYNVRDRHDTFQYRAFGVPDLALKRGLASDLVVAPYATALAMAVDAHESLRNLAELESRGALGAYGFYDALDYTHLMPDERVAIVRTFMAHHVGMSLVALDNALSVDETESEGIWQRRFMADAAVRATALLLDERAPRRYVPRPPQSDTTVGLVETASPPQIAVHEVDTPHTDEPHMAVLGGIGYNVLLTNTGSGNSRTNGIDVLRWRADPTQDDTGQWIYIKDLSTGALWSAGYQPVRAEPRLYRATFAADRVIFGRRDGPVETRTEVVVVASEQAEVRRVTLVNRSPIVRELELTSYGEVVLCPPGADRAHPAFQKLFVQTEWVPGGALLASRRPRASGETWPWCVHVVAPGPERVGEVTCESDRARFIGRGRTVHGPRALDADVSLSGSVGAVLDPIVALRVRLRIEPGRSASVAFTTAVAATREAALHLADRYRDSAAADRALSLARTEAEVEVRDLDIAPADLALYQELAGALVYPHEALRAPASERAAVTLGQTALWAQGISGDLPIVLATIRAVAGVASVRQLLVAHRYWRSKGIRSDLVILNAKPHSYAQELHDQLMTIAMASGEGGVLEKPGGVFVRRADSLSPADTALLRATARIHVICDGVGLGEVVATNILSHATLAPPQPATAERVEVGAGFRDAGATRPAYANGYGQTTDSGDFEIGVAGECVPPAPWANVIANPAIGFCVTERGGGFAWAENSHFFRLTPWFNDPVSDPCGEVLYLKDADSGAVWTPTPGPAAAIGDAGRSPHYRVEHRPGATRFWHERGDIATELSLAVPVSDAVKITRLRVANRGKTSRRLSVTSYVDWLLGAEQEQARHQLHTRRDPVSGALFAQNHFAPDFTDRTAFSWISERVTTYTARRDEFVGRSSDLASPAGLRTDELSGATGAGFDACAALQCKLVLKPGETREIVVLLGTASSDLDARALIDRYGSPAASAVAIRQVTGAWDDRLSVIRVRTPEPDLDVLFNRWSLYQALSCRMWARAALYQSSGAYGFRDQLQDCMAFVYAEPALARAHLLRAAGRQFIEGDVQHWWHEPSGRGVRTRFSDDLAWLPFVADHYVRVTGDRAVLDERAPYLAMRALGLDEQEAYDLPTVSDETASLYEHCVRAVERACTIGEHGLPLIGAGDWNDGMNRVGAKGKGESVWLAWFLAATLRRFAVHADARADARATVWRAWADAYAGAAERTSGDGAWYVRAYFDDGAPLGSSGDEECRIDSIAQSWAVISGAADPTRARVAMQSVNEQLVRKDLGLVLLLTPPFDRSPRDPGYIKGYLPGVRENGAQYTHAALWAALAMTRLGEGDRAGELMRMLNPLSHTRAPDGVQRYMVEPYVVAGDVYAAAGHEGRGGWSWYTGSASWSYRVVLEGMLGFDKVGDRLRLDPCIPTAWPAFALDYRYGASTYSIDVQNPSHVSHGVLATKVDGVLVSDGWIPLVDDGARHIVTISLGPTRRPAEKSQAAMAAAT